MNQKIRQWGKSLWQEWLLPAIIIIAIIAPVRSAIADWNDVPTGSMKPTILEGDRVFVNKLAYDLKVPFTTMHIATWDNPQRGDVIVFFSPADGKRLVKRVVGLPGDHLSLHDNVLLVNGVAAEYDPLDENVVKQIDAAERRQSIFAEEKLGSVEHAVMGNPANQTIRTFPTISLKPDQYFVMGDNRDNSFDSRYFGPVDRHLIVGKAVGVAFSLDHSRYFLPRSGRFLLGLY